ncbi:MAG TPA: hypothetical protein VMU48_09975 [Terracidiphilus sp.]|nr:hypothetical protein [Terracidiphilus sp.]
MQFDWRRQVSRLGMRRDRLNFISYTLGAPAETFDFLLGEDAVEQFRSFGLFSRKKLLGDDRNPGAEPAFALGAFPPNK